MIKRPEVNFLVIRKNQPEKKEYLYKVIHCDTHKITLLRKKKRTTSVKSKSDNENEKIKLKEAKLSKANDKLLDFDLFLKEIFCPNTTTNIKSNNLTLNTIKSKASKEAANRNRRKLGKQVSSISLKSIKSQTNKKTKKKRKFPSSLFDIDNFVVQSSTKIDDKHKILNIPIPKYSVLSSDFYSNDTNADSTLINEDTSDERYLTLHQDFEKREQLYKQSFTALKKNQNNKIDHLETLPCMYEES